MWRHRAGWTGHSISADWHGGCSSRSLQGQRSDVTYRIEMFQSYYSASASQSRNPEKNDTKMLKADTSPFI